MASPKEVLPVQGNHGNFHFEIHSPSSTTSTLKLVLPAGGSIKAKAGSMVATSSNIEITGKLSKSLLNSKSTMTAKDGTGWVVLSPPFLGSITPVHINNETIRIGDNAFLASVGDIKTETKTQSMSKALFSGHGLFIREVSGNGIVFVSAVGSMMTLSIASGETIIVDNGHLVTWPSNLKQEFKRASKSMWSSALSGEGMVTKITGPGQVNIQTKSGEDMARWIYESSPPQ